MEMYTELIFGAGLKEDTPEKIINTLKYLINDEDSLINEENLCLDMIYKRNPLRGVSRIWFDNILNSWHISTRANIKNYEKEIENFLEWIKPHIERGSGAKNVYAFVMYEDADEPEIYYLEND